MQRDRFRFAKAALLLTATAVTSASCAALRPPRVPMETLPLVERDEANTLVVLLPGRLDAPRDFARRGLLDIVRRARPNADVLAVDAHLGYYRGGTIRERLWLDVLEPASRRYGEIRLVGVSLGGIGALAMASSHASAIDGVVILAPYLGPDSLIDEIEAAGGPEPWRASEPDEPLAGIWTHFRQRPAGSGPSVFLGYGTDDRRADHHRLFARLLDDRHVVALPGGHRWPVWAELLEELVDRGGLGAAS